MWVLRRLHHRDVPFGRNVLCMVGKHATDHSIFMLCTSTLYIPKRSIYCTQYVLKICQIQSNKSGQTHESAPPRYYIQSPSRYDARTSAALSYSAAQYLYQCSVCDRHLSMQIMETISGFSVKPLCICERERSGKAQVPHLSCQTSGFSWRGTQSRSRAPGDSIQMGYCIRVSQRPCGGLERETQESVEETANIPLSLFFLFCYFLKLRWEYRSCISLSVFFPSLTTHRSFLLL